MILFMIYLWPMQEIIPKQKSKNPKSKNQIDTEKLRILKEVLKAVQYNVSFGNILISFFW